MKISVIIYNLFFLLTLFSLYFLNNNRTGDVTTLNSILSVVTLFFIFGLAYFIYGKLLKFSYFEWSLLFTLVFLTVFTYIFRRFVIVHLIYLLVALLISKGEDLLSEKFRNWIVILILCSILIQLSIFRFYDRPVLSYIDPNYSSLFIFCFFAYCWKYGYKKIAILVAFLGLLTLSRAYFLALFLFFFIYILTEASSFFRDLLIRLNFVYVFILSHIFLFIFSIIFIQQLTFEEAINNYVKERTISGVLVVREASNYYRFKANTAFMNELKNNSSNYFFGRDLEDYTKNVFINSPHNSFFQMILNYGLFFSIFYFFFIVKILKSYYTIDNIPFIYSILIFMLFLGGVVFGISIIWISFILVKTKIKNDVL